MRKLKITEMHRLTADAFRQAEKVPLVVVLDNVRSMHNVGSIFRTADAFRLQGLCLCGITATPPHPELHKTALGAEDVVEWHHYDNTLQAVLSLKEQGYTLLAVEQAEGSTMLHRFGWQKGKRYAVVVGHEVKGVDQQVIDDCDGCVEIEQHGTKHSMNVSVAAGIVMWEAMKGIGCG